MFAAPSNAATQPIVTLMPIVVPSVSHLDVPADVAYTDELYTVTWSGPVADRVRLSYLINGKEYFIINVLGTNSYTHWMPPEQPDPDHPSNSVYHYVRLKAVWQNRTGSGTYTNISTATSDYFTIARPGALVIMNQSLPVAYTGQWYHPKLQAEGGNKPYYWQIVSGTLPAGLTMNQYGQINGTPRETGSRTVRFRVTDASVDILQDQIDLQIAVTEPGQPTAVPSPFDYWLRLGGSDAVTTTNIDRPAEGQVTVSKSLLVGASGDNFRTVSLDVTGVPAGVDVSFSPRSGLPPLTSAMNITVHNNVVPDTYTITIRGTTESGMVRTLQHRLNISTLSTGGDIYLARAYQPVAAMENISIQPIQAFTSHNRLVKGKNTMFMATIGSTFNMDMDVEVELWLAESDWEWDGKPVAGSQSLRTETMGTYNFPRHIVYSRTVTVPAHGEVEITIPDLSEQTLSRIHTTGHGYQDEIDVITDAPRPAHSGGPDYWTDEPEYTVVIDPYDRITETNERNNVPKNGYHRMETYPSGELNILYTPFLSNEDEIEDYYPGGVSGSTFRQLFRENISWQAENTTEFFLGVYPVGEDNIHYFASEGIMLRDSYHTVDDLELNDMQQQLCDMAAENGYDRLVAMVPWDGWYGGHSEWWGVVYSSNPRACFVRMLWWDYLIAVHESYHNLGHPDEYTSAHNISASEGYWFNRKRTLVGSAAPANYLHDYMDYAGYDYYWTKKSRYETLMYQLRTAEDPQVLVFRCTLFQNGSAGLKPFMIVDGIPDPQASEWNYRILLKDSGGKTVTEQKVYASFTKSVFGAPGSQSGTFPVDRAFITSTVNWSDNVTSIELRDREDTLIVKREVSQNAPSVELSEPVPGTVWDYGNTYKVKWTGSDIDGDPLNYSLSISPDKENWLPVDIDIQSTEYSFDTKTISEGTYYFRVRATDGVLSASDVMDQSFEVKVTGPVSTALPPATSGSATPPGDDNASGQSPFLFGLPVILLAGGILALIVVGLIIMGLRKK
ncbi:MAG: hypothetical protein A4E28_02443 [Methanocella sp. PtaU1.Bin125]|nr:MAG: hypothetical protein A4E28_02443 [Methanocella sp. PtaU1.Bin125]